MNPILGQIIVISVLAVIVFFCAREMIRDIKAELSGKGTCAGCSGCSNGSGFNKDSMQCCACMERMEELKKLAVKKQERSNC